MSYPPIRYRGAEGEPSAQLRPAGYPPELVTDVGEVSYLATGGTTGGDFGLYRYVMAGPPAGPGAHFHKTMSESFFVLSGTVRLYDGRAWTDAHAGDFLHVPPGGVHAFRNESGERAEMLLLFTPGAPREAYFEELAARAASGQPFSDEEREDLYRRHDQFMV